MTETLDAFLEIKYGKLYALDLHGKTLEEAKSELVYTLEKIDNCFNGILVIHGYHKGVVLKNYIRNNFTYRNVCKKINIDASRTLLLVQVEK